MIVVYKTDDLHGVRIVETNSCAIFDTKVDLTKEKKPVFKAAMLPYNMDYLVMAYVDQGSLKIYR